MKDLYDMSQEECIEFAKCNIVDSIYSSAKIEGIAVTFQETQQIYDGKGVANLSIDDTNKVNNLKCAWMFLFDSIDYPMDVLYLRQLNQIINIGLTTDAGMIRNYNVNIGGTSWRPEMPNIEKITADVKTIMKMNCCTEKAIKLMLYVMRMQMFSDGNKRVAQLAANQILIQNGSGLLRIPVEKNNEFFKLLVEFYETNDDKRMLEFIHETSIIGIKRDVEVKLEPINENMFIKR